mmetsp:Transcript_29925/g.45343  ORF Transcript_29925/g.45343 Transcript_29925/m.45343 type:complete len:95 (+) Transcript_29925:992-1276(+)
MLFHRNGLSAVYTPGTAAGVKAVPQRFDQPELLYLPFKDGSFCDFSSNAWRVDTGNWFGGNLLFVAIITQDEQKHFEQLLVVVMIRSISKYGKL